MTRTHVWSFAAILALPSQAQFKGPVDVLSAGSVSGSAQPTLSRLPDQEQRLSPNRPAAPPTAARALTMPALDVLVLGLLVWALWRFRAPSQDRDRLFRASYSDRLPLPPIPLRAVAYPSDAEARRLRGFRDHWIDRFVTIQRARAGGDLASVAGVLSAQGAAALQLGAVPGPAMSPTITSADPADSWTDGEIEYVTVHFVGNWIDPRRAELKQGHFDEFWTFSRSGEGAWQVASVRSGERDPSIPRLTLNK